MDWKEYWSDLLKQKKLREKVNEMNQADIALGNPLMIEDICHQIYIDYANWETNLKGIRTDFFNEIESLTGIHLQSNRIKKVDSLIVKVITKRYENLKNQKSNYSRITGDNYKDIISDLIGMRLIINYRGKWTTIHDKIIDLFPYQDNKEYYDSMELLPHPDDKKAILVEIPKVYYAKGDEIGQYLARGLKAVMHKMGYRSIHYTISYQGVYIEIQVRTIYDEAWSDCDHSYVYKQDENKSHTALKQISGLLCKLTNLSNDVGEGMRDIFESQSMLEIQGNKWKTTKEVLELFDQSLNRMDEIYNGLKEFRKKIEVIEEKGGEQ